LNVSPPALGQTFPSTADRNVFPTKLHHFLEIDRVGAKMTFTMKRTKPAPPLDRLISSLVDCLTPESARRILALKADAKFQAYVDDLADRHTEGRLTPDELKEYDAIVSFDTFVAILKSKARQFLAASRGE
jgi:hypothetical protein